MSPYLQYWAGAQTISGSDVFEGPVPCAYTGSQLLCVVGGGDVLPVTRRSQVIFKVLCLKEITINDTDCG